MELVNETKTAKVAKTLEKLILDGKLPKGSFLPSQQELATQFQTSSRPIREALKLLEAKGLIQINQGRKAQVCSNNLDQFVGSLSASLLTQYKFNRKIMKNLMQVCVSVITNAARGFSRCENRKTVIEELRNTVDKMEKHQDDIVKLLSDERKYFYTLVKANNNQILLAIYDNMMPLVVGAISQISFSSMETEKQTKNCTYLLEALEDGQTDLAVALALVTLSSMEDKVLAKFPDESEALA
jgi:DNA-binding FadR family transcriptional regulator